MNSGTEPPQAIHPPVVDRLRIAVRERPASDEELPLTQVLLRADQDKLVAFAPNATDGLMYDFDYFYPQNARQDDVFRTVGLEMVDLVMGGLSANCIATGYAETGKTHTLFGSPNESGLIQDTVRELFQRLEAQANTHEYSVGVSYWEMNCNGVHDNLSDDDDAVPDRGVAGASGPTRNHAVYRDGFGRLYLSNVTEKLVADFDAFEALLNRGNERRVRRGYERQFRWHGFVQLSLMTVDKEIGEQCVLRRVTFVHTKGSERVGANRAPKQILREGSQVNVSSTLLNAAVIHSLEYRGKRAGQCRTRAQLHRLIQQSESFFMECRYTQVMSQLMCGHEACFVIGCVDPLSYMETAETLENLQLYRHLVAACMPVVTPSERGRLLRQLRTMESAMGDTELLQSIYLGTSDRPYTEQEEALLALRGKVETWGDGEAQRRSTVGAPPSRRGVDAEGRSTRRVVFLNAAKTATYEGQWRDGVFEGFGEHIQSTFKYRGEFRGGMREGHGTLFLRDGKGLPYRRVYDGEWLGGRRDGRGTQWGDDGDVYEGDFAADTRHGLGKLYLANGDVVEGNFRHDRCEGWAVLRQKSGDWFEGYWMAGEREGPGVWHYVARQRCLRGEWHHNKAVFGSMEDDTDKADDTTGSFIPRLALLHSDDILAQQRERLTEKRRLEFAAVGKTWTDYAAMDRRSTVPVASVTAASAAPPVSADGHAVYGLEIE
ncbi:Kinesin motor domain/MORN repeat [Novymonas esmeraldas]|uniref:MORN repeat-containing protein 3 n=1 Tax=Novymonas esmeraldas TaxID=1808958 RepID=A0AAW0F2J7_9TRYP